MVFIVAESSLHHALDTLPVEKRLTYKEIFTIPGLSLNCHAEDPKKIVQNLLLHDFAEKTEVVIWHDMLDNSLSKHKSNSYRALCFSELVEKLKSLENKLRALVCCHRIRRHDISDVLKTQSIPVLRNRIYFFSTRKQNDPKFLNELKAIHQRLGFELNYLDISLRKKTDLAQITAKSRPKRPSERARKAYSRC